MTVAARTIRNSPFTELTAGVVASICSYAAVLPRLAGS